MGVLRTLGRYTVCCLPFSPRAAERYDVEMDEKPSDVLRYELVGGADKHFLPFLSTTDIADGGNHPDYLRQVLEKLDEKLKNLQPMSRGWQRLQRTLQEARRDWVYWVWYGALAEELYGVVEKAKQGGAFPNINHLVSILNFYQSSAPSFHWELKKKIMAADETISRDTQYSENQRALGQSGFSHALFKFFQSDPLVEAGVQNLSLWKFDTAPEVVLQKLNEEKLRAKRGKNRRLDLIEETAFAAAVLSPKKSIDEFVASSNLAQDNKLNGEAMLVQLCLLGDFSRAKHLIEKHGVDPYCPVSVEKVHYGLRSYDNLQRFVRSVKQGPQKKFSAFEILLKAMAPYFQKKVIDTKKAQDLFDCYDLVIQLTLDKRGMFIKNHSQWHWRSPYHEDLLDQGLQFVVAVWEVLREQLYQLNLLVKLKRNDNHKSQFLRGLRRCWYSSEKLFAQLVAQAKLISVVREALLLKEMRVRLSQAVSPEDCFDRIYALSRTKPMGFSRGLWVYKAPLKIRRQFQKNIFERRKELVRTNDQEFRSVLRQSVDRHDVLIAVREEMESTSSCWLQAEGGSNVAGQVEASGGGRAEEAGAIGVLSSENSPAPSITGMRRRTPYHRATPVAESEDEVARQDAPESERASVSSRPRRLWERVRKKMQAVSASARDVRESVAQGVGRLNERGSQFFRRTPANPRRRPDASGETLMEEAFQKKAH